MSLRFAALGVVSLVVAFVLVGCGSSGDSSGSVGEDLTPELVVPPVSQQGAKELSATPMPIPTATVESIATATVQPSPTAMIEPTATEVLEKPRVKIPNRGYNSMGSEDAPIVMFDFSDFL